MNSKDCRTIEKILEEINFLQNITKDVKLDSFINNEEKMRAAAMTLINIGELVRILSDKFKESVKNIPFNEIMATRNIAAHGYHALNFYFIWDTIKNDIPDMKQKLEKLLVIH